MTNAEADTQYALWSGVCYVTPLLGGWIADSYLGERFEIREIVSPVHDAALVLSHTEVLCKGENDVGWNTRCPLDGICV